LLFKRRGDDRQTIQWGGRERRYGGKPLNIFLV
jgi:hypothetical protein